jgi:hypothetical protein
MIELQVLNLANLVPVEFEAQISDATIKELMHNIVDGARAHWIQLAAKEFHTTKTMYIAGIQEVDWQGEDTAVISLVGVMPNMLEQGASQVDMHETLLGSNVPVASKGGKGKHERALGGYYRAIPFRHYTPGAGAHGATMGSAFEKAGFSNAQDIGKSVYEAAKKLKGSISDPYTGKTTWGERLNTENLQSVATRSKLDIPKLKSYHKDNPYQGMVRFEKTYEKATQSSYGTFRTIAVDAQGNGVGSSPWIRPAMPGKHLAAQVAEFVTTRLAPETFEAYVASLK